MKKRKNTISVSILVISVVVLIIGLSQCGCGTVRYTDSKVIQQPSDKQVEAIATRSSYLMVGEDSLTYTLKEAGPKIIKRKITLHKHNDGEIEYTQRPVLKQNDFAKTNTAYILKHNFDLMGGTIVMPADCELVFDGGSLNNGTLVGNNTSIDYSGTIFNNVGIKGNWNVSEIRSSMFGDAATCCNRLRDVISLTNGNVENRVFIEPGDYNLEVNKYSDKLLALNSHTTLVLDGTLHVSGGNYPRYGIIAIIDASDVTIKGSGKIVGDKEIHIYTPEVPDPESKRGLNSSHEYGHGIEVVRSEDISISGITITNCIGDGVFIEGDDGIICHNLVINHCRRQGIAVVDGKNIEIHDCNVFDIMGVNKAGFGIDIEPRGGQSVANVKISKCYIYNCNGGISCAALTIGSLTNATIRDCRLASFARDTIENHMQHRAIICSNLVDCEINNCVINEYDSRSVVYVEKSDNFRFVNNFLQSKGSQFGLVIRNMAGLIYVEKNSIYLYEKTSDKPYGVALTNLHNAVVEDNDILAGNLSYTADTPCRNVVLRRNKINARWNPGVNISDSVVDDNIFEKNVKISSINNSVVKNNKFQSIMIQQTNNCIFSANRSLTSNRIISFE